MFLKASRFLKHAVVKCTLYGHRNTTNKYTKKIILYTDTVNVTKNSYSYKFTDFDLKKGKFRLDKVKCLRF